MRAVPNWILHWAPSPLRLHQVQAISAGSFDAPSVLSNGHTLVLVATRIVCSCSDSFADGDHPVVTIGSKPREVAIDKLRRLAALGGDSDGRIAELARQCVTEIEVIHCSIRRRVTWSYLRDSGCYFCRIRWC